MMWYLHAGLLVLASLTGVSAAGAEKWVATWQAPPAPPMPLPPAAESRPTTPVFDDKTIIQVVRVTGEGARVRLRFSNEYGVTPLTLGSVKVQRISRQRSKEEFGAQNVTFSHRNTVTIPAGAPVLSDPVDLEVKQLDDLKISIFVDGKAPACSCHAVAAATTIVSPTGDYTNRSFQPLQLPYSTFRAFLTGVEVEAAPKSRVILAFGDSITDGYLSSADTNRRYPDRLADRLIARSGSRSPNVINAGISGNRLLADGRIATMGQSALGRFDRDVLSVPGVSHVIVLEGINDIGVGGAVPPTTADLIGAYRQLIARARSQGIKVIGGTLLPYEGAAYFHENGEVVRQALNAWIRQSGEFDGVIDFDAALRDPTNPRRMRVEFQAGDWLHPNDAGYRAMADAIDLRILDK
ncbi:SGNH/GDSL hydrolase family protein [Parafrankia sp. BMG5.11]|uniref:SGNH/GDSL hydrolase family protein n=1 Tax=Parafrankia sp. BMG5.11 TaxID=222540 RepID=UPI0010388C7E|nr:SGNH/GDSL hydrolase family protein [Parafrankia sp. BMG5.11]TCJ41406.1 SGNH/GDSL hydrolase family protein [Parafrankia sp. BMG5.11]